MIFKTFMKALNTSLIITQCINSIIEKNTLPGDFISVSTDKIFKNTSVARMDYLGEMKSHFNFLPEVKFYVFENIADEDFKLLLDIIRVKYYDMFNSRAKYLFVGKGFSSRYLELLKKHYILKAAFLDVSDDLIYKLHYGEQFFDNPRLQLIGNCMKADGISDVLFSQNLTENYFRTKGITLKFDEQPMYSCTTCQRKGIELELFELMFNHMTINYTSTNSVETSENSDISVGSRVLENSYENDFTAPYIEDCMTWFVPLPKKIPRWRYILYVFNITIWTSWIVSVIVLAVVWIFTHTITKQDKSSLNVFDYILIAFLGRKKKFRKSKSSHEILIFSIIFLSFMLNCLFSTRMTYLLNGINYEDEIKSTEDIAKNSLMVAASSKYMQNLIVKMPGLENYPKKYYTECFNSQICNEQIKFYKRMAIFAPSKQTRYLKHDKLEKKYSWHLKELPVSYYTAKIVAQIVKGHPMSHVIKRQIIYAIESGIVDKITAEHFTEEEEEITFEPTESLTLEHILTPISILFIGLTLSTIIFIFEKRKKNRIAN